MIVVEELLGAVTSEHPAGPNLEYEKPFIELERAARGRPEQQIGEHVVAGEGPDWRDVERRARELARGTRDLRLATHLTRALLHTHGLAGFAQGVALVRGLIEQHWAEVHPQLDPDDGDDPTLRVNVLSELTDVETVVAWLRAAPLVRARGLGEFSLRDVALATGEQKPRAGDPPPADPSVIDAAFAAAPLEDVRATLEAARGAARACADIESLVAERVGSEGALRLTRLREVLAHAVRVLEPHVAKRAGAEPAAAAHANGNGAGNGAVTAAAAAPPPAGLSGEITSRDDVVKALDKICKYYERHEPSSPIPLLVRRCRRLVNKSFLEILRDIAPDGVGQVEMLRGAVEEGSE